MLFARRGKSQYLRSGRIKLAANLLQTNRFVVLFKSGFKDLTFMSDFRNFIYQAVAAIDVITLMLEMQWLDERDKNSSQDVRVDELIAIRVQRHPSRYRNHIII